MALTDIQFSKYRNDEKNAKSPKNSALGGFFMAKGLIIPYNHYGVCYRLWRGFMEKKNFEYPSVRSIPLGMPFSIYPDFQ